VSQPSYFQLSQETREDRFPKIFSLVKEVVPAPARILSFGCSTGLECFTLRKYWPESMILGHDINTWAINSAVKQRNDRKIENMLFSSKLKDDSKFDAIFALMVFFSIENPLSKEVFEQGVSSVASRLNTGGVIAFRNLEYRFRIPGFDTIKEWSHINNRNPKRKYYGGVYRLKPNE
jgi:trans-aconitate methyltransferase